MLYVFHVDVGRMLSFDMNVALSSVENLKDTIERLHGIPAANIVLLVSGGEMLTQSTQVSFYSAGTDTNPIYMFLTGDVRLAPSVPQSEQDLDLQQQVERSLALPVSYDTVEKRAKLALRMHELAREEDRMCERLVHEQHLQQQGWSAVMANMEDLTSDFRLRFRDFCAAFDRHLEKRSKYLDLLHSFDDDLSKLRRIPILPGLMPLAEADFHGFDKLLDNDDVFSNTNQESVLLAPGTPLSTVQVVQETTDAMLQAIEAKDDEKSITPNSPNKTKPANEDEGSAGVALAGHSNSPSTHSTSSTRRQNNLNLLQWITSKENHNALKLMSDECIQGLNTFNEEIYEKLKLEIQNIIKLAEQNDVKEIKGLGERLCKLEEFKYKVKAMVKDQKEQSTALQQNQNRAMNLGDASVLPDLCASHQSQLMVMLQNHQKIREHRRLIARAKDELGCNLHTRMKRIVWIENAMSEFDNRLLFYHRCLRRAERHICIIEQIHQAPCIYVAAVTEVVRRRIFSGEFREWAAKLSEDFTGIHSEEIKRRQQFNASFEGHFLNILFPGMHDMPPAFANDNTLAFDTCLPNLTKSDIDTLTSQLPDLATQIQLPDMDSVINFFVSRSGACDEPTQQQKERFEDLLKQQVANALNIEISGDEKPLQHERVSDLQREAAASGRRASVGCEESETDTEIEFEQLSAAGAMNTANATATAEMATSTVATATMARSTGTEPLLTQSAGTLTEETDLGAITELERMRPLLAALHKLAMDCLQISRSNLSNLRSDAENARVDLQADLATLNEKWLAVQQQMNGKEQAMQQATKKQSNELERLRNDLQERESELNQMRATLAEMDMYRIKCATMETQMEELRDKLKMAVDETNAAVADAREELIHEHKTEIESLRCRFKLMTSMERSPSDTSLEKIERPASSSETANVIDLAQHEALLQQQRATFEAEKEQAIEEALDIERSLWQSFNAMNTETLRAEHRNMLRDMMEEKEKELDQLRAQQRMLLDENFILQTRLNALTNDEGNSLLLQKIEKLKLVKSRLEDELTSEKARRIEMESSFAALRSSTYETAGILPRSSQKYIVLESCTKGDIVFVVWSIRHGQFMVVQDSQSLYFVHGDSLAGLNLRLPLQQQADGVSPDEVPIPMPYYAIGRVIEKEYCQARKDENRYRVQRGAKFYRIKLEPLTTRISMRRERLESYSASTSRSLSQCDTQNEFAGMQLSTQQQQQQIRAKIGATSVNNSDNQKNKNKDTVDASTITLEIFGQPIITTTTTSSGQIALTHFKERTVSITSANEEDDEPISIRSERCHYTSVSEEDELPGAHVESGVATTATTTEGTAMRSESGTVLEKATTTAAAATTTQTQKPLTETVITEQPTATTTKELQMQLMLASADIIQPTQQQQKDKTITTSLSEGACDNTAQTAVPAAKRETDSAYSESSQYLSFTETANSNRENVIKAETTTTTTVEEAEAINKSQCVAADATSAINLQLDKNLLTAEAPTTATTTTRICCSTSMPTTIGTATTSEDSDEYRSLEGKEDDTDFPISE